jgi:hypothetical protein
MVPAALYMAERVVESDLFNAELVQMLLGKLPPLEGMVARKLR